MTITEWVSIRCEQAQVLAVASAPFHLQNSFIWGVISNRPVINSYL